MQVSHPNQNSGRAGAIHQAVVEVVINERQRFHSENRTERKCLMKAFVGWKIALEVSGKHFLFSRFLPPSFAYTVFRLTILCKCLFSMERWNFSKYKACKIIYSFLLCKNATRTLAGHFLAMSHSFQITLLVPCFSLQQSPNILIHLKITLAFLNHLWDISKTDAETHGLGTTASVDEQKALEVLVRQWYKLTWILSSWHL